MKNKKFNQLTRAEKLIMLKLLTYKVFLKSLKLSVFLIFFILQLLTDSSIGGSVIGASVGLSLYLILYNVIMIRVTKYICYDRFTGMVSMSVCKGIEHSGATAFGKAEFLTEEYLRALKILSKKKSTKKIKFTTHKLVLLQLIRIYKRNGLDTSKITCKSEGKSMLAEKVYLITLKDFFNDEVDYVWFFKKTEKFEVELDKEDVKKIIK